MGLKYIIRTQKLKHLIKTIKKYFPGNLEHDVQRKEYRFTWTESLERELWGGKR